jgi:glutathione S-transferase
VSALVAPVPRLVTIPFSHYCEKARWGLDHAGVAHVEAPYLPMLHVPAVKAVGGDHQVPVLVTADGLVADSTDILRWCDAQTAPERRLWPDDPVLAAEVSAWEERFDAELGPDARRVAYGGVLGDAAYLRGMVARTLPPWQRAVFAVARLPAVAMIRRAYGIHPAGVARARSRLDALFADVGACLADGRPYLVGERFTAADLTFAALAGPVVFPPELDAIYGRLEDAPAEVRGVVAEIRAMPAGRHVLAVYAGARR